jgi:hypothetical protein
MSLSVQPREINNSQEVHSMKFLLLITVKAGAKPTPEVVLKHKEWVLQEMKRGAMEAVYTFEGSSAPRQSFLSACCLIKECYSSASLIVVFLRIRDHKRLIFLFVRARRCAVARSLRDSRYWRAPPMSALTDPVLQTLAAVPAIAPNTSCRARSARQAFTRRCRVRSCALVG